jgi:tetratricopeptide (TPR) repeat protein
MIVKNEERFLEGCLLSVRDHVDEMVVVDTGSTDRTCDIARDHGATLIERAWPGNFAEARNWALDAATGGWILYIDADERFAVPPGVDLKALLSDERAAAYNVRFQPRVNSTFYREIRVFRNDPRIRFNGVIHETVHNGILQVCRDDDRAILDSALSISHLGYEGDLTHKYHRNIPLLRQAVEQVPGRVFYWLDLARSLAGIGEFDEAVAMCRRATEVSRADSKAKQKADGSLAYQTWAMLLLSRNLDALSVAEEGLTEYPEDRVLWLVHARALVRAGRPEEALHRINALLADDPGEFYDPLVAYDRRVFREYAYDLEGIALLRLGRHAEAADAFERAANAAPEDRSYRMKAIAARGQAARLNAAQTAEATG